MPRIQFICLANSWKMGGRCVAGWRTDGRGWIRPVSAQVDGTLASLEYVYADGTDAALLDIVEVDVTAARPEPHQPENWVLAPRKWKLVQQLPRAVAMQYLS